jgi:hypothetical protein
VENKSAQTKMRSSRSKAVEGEGKNRQDKSVYLFERAKSYEVGLGRRPAPAVRVDLRSVRAAEKILLRSQPHTPSTSIPCSPTLIVKTKRKTRVITKRDRQRVRDDNERRRSKPE